MKTRILLLTQCKLCLRLRRLLRQATQVVILMCSLACSQANSVLEDPDMMSRKRRPSRNKKNTEEKMHKTQQEFLEIQRQRNDNFRVYVDNKSRLHAFKMAVMGYNAFKDHDPEQAEYYKQQMERILGNAVDLIRIRLEAGIIRQHTTNIRASVRHVDAIH
ncbi:hypothetical protein IV203_033419 [Nitzschia inconspicua]|uniref:Uncharacterized protein n=1 Tax=Nitzschia inconspicua TaxID=303405 RepID=A0A9K3K4J1_9STRA|nr:hypothetical protein IV203_033419 [Nitzschia inconspicua]